MPSDDDSIACSAKHYHSELLALVQGHKKWVLCVAWSPDGEMVATGGMEGALWLWDPKSGNPIGCCKGGPSPLASLHVMQGGMPGRFKQQSHAF